MKGVILLCLKDMVSEKFGKDKWDKIVVSAGNPRIDVVLPISNVDDATVISLVEASCKELNIAPEQAADSFGDYWVNNYSQKLYKGYYTSHKTAKDFLLAMDRVHVSVTQQIKDSRPPRFTYEWPKPDTLVMHYKSGRGLIDFLVGLIKGVGKHYNDPLSVTKLNNEKVQVVFK